MFIVTDLVSLRLCEFLSNIILCTGTFAYEFSEVLFRSFVSSCVHYFHFIMLLTIYLLASCSFEHLYYILMSFICPIAKDWKVYSLVEPYCFCSNWQQHKNHKFVL